MPITPDDEFTALAAEPPQTRTIAVRSSALREGDAETLSLRISFERTGDLSVVDEIAYTTVDIDATEGVDYSGGGRTIRFAAGVGLVVVVGAVSIFGDLEREPDESFMIVLSDPGGNAPGLALVNGAIAILDDDDRPPPPRTPSQGRLCASAPAPGSGPGHRSCQATGICHSHR